MSLKAKVEAVIFLTDKPLAAAAIAQVVNADVQTVRQVVLELIHDYEERNSALEIADDGGYMMQVKDEYATFANDLAPIELPISIVRTLSAIAIKQPVLQSEIVRIRGAGAYDHIKELLEKELITKKEEGRSSLLSTTKKFQEYFRLSQDAKVLRDRLKEQTKTEGDGESIADGTSGDPAEAAIQKTIADISVPETGTADTLVSETASAGENSQSQEFLVEPVIAETDSENVVSSEKDNFETDVDEESEQTTEISSPDNRSALKAQAGKENTVIDGNIEFVSSNVI